MESRVVDNPEEQRFELWLEGRLAGEIRYAARDDRTIVLIHTEIDRSLEGRGLGNVLVQGALDDLRQRGIGFVPVCPFVRAYLKRHPQD